MVTFTAHLSVTIKRFTRYKQKAVLTAMLEGKSMPSNMAANTNHTTLLKNQRTIKYLPWMRFLSNFGCKIPSHCLREELVTSPLSASGLLCLKTDLNFAFRNISATHTWRVVNKKWLISHVHTKCKPTSDFSAKALNNCENLGIKYVQQSESAIKHRIYFTVEFQELLQICWKT